MSRRILIVIVIVLIIVIAGWVVFNKMSGPLYHPGDVRAGKDLREPLAPPSQAGAAPQFWKVASDIDLFHFEQGAGEDVLTVHGGPGFVQNQSWKANAALADRYRFIYYHQRGCGRSSRPITKLARGNFYQSMQALNGALGLAAHVADIERIRRILGRDKLVLAGHSFGAFIAALYAAEFPEHVKALVFISPANMAVLPNLKADLFARMRRRLPPEQLPDYDRYLAQYFDFPSQMRMSEEQLAAMYRRFGVFYAAASHAAPPIEDMEALSMNGGFMPLAIYLSLGRHHDYTAALRAVTAPVLVIHGGADLQPRDWSLAFASLFPNHRFVEIEGAGHFSFDDHPVEFAAVVRDFLSKF